MNPILTLAEIEKNHIFEVMKLMQQNKAATARALGISLKTLYNKLAEYEKQKEEVKS